MRNFKVVAKDTSDVYVVLAYAGETNVEWGTVNKYLLRKISDNSMRVVDADDLATEFIFLEFYEKDGPK